MNWKECEQNQPWYVLKYYSIICLEGLSETTKNVARIAVSKQKKPSKLIPKVT